MVKALLITGAALVLAVGAAAGDTPAAAGKDLCLFDVKQCPGGEEYNIVDKYDRLKAEVAKGAAVYSPEELTHLKKSLKSAEDLLTLLGIGCH